MYVYISFSVTYKEVGYLESCDPGGVINSPQECREALEVLGLIIGTPAFSGTWRGDPSGCIKMRFPYYGTKWHKNMVYYNYANDIPPNTDHRYYALCRC